MIRRNAALLAIALAGVLGLAILGPDPALADSETPPVELVDVVGIAWLYLGGAILAIVLAIVIVIAVERFERGRR